jgi:hypothetical protein
MGQEFVQPTSFADGSFASRPLPTMTQTAPEAVEETKKPEIIETTVNPPKPTLNEAIEKFSAAVKEVSGYSPAGPAPVQGAKPAQTVVNIEVPTRAEFNKLKQQINSSFEEVSNILMDLQSRFESYDERFERYNSRSSHKI